MNLVINNKVISTNENGLYSLNDLHSAAGGLNNQKPSLFYRSDNFKFLCSHLKECGVAEPIIKKQGRYNGGTWGVKEVIVFYSKWLGASIYSDLCKAFGISGISLNYTRNEKTFSNEVIENLFSGYEIIAQHPILNRKYILDWYIPELNLAIEYDEQHHKTNKNKKSDIARQEEIEKELGCKFLRYTE